MKTLIRMMLRWTFFLTLICGTAMAADSGRLVREETTLVQIPGAAEGTQITRGTAAEVLFEIEFGGEAWSWVQVGGESGYVRTALLEPLPGSESGSPIPPEPGNIPETMVSTVPTEAPASLTMETPPLSTPVPEPTVTLPQTSQRVYAFSEAVINSTEKTLERRFQWTDSEQRGPYQVSIALLYGKDQKQELWKSETTACEYTTNQLVPGSTYQIRVTDTQGETIVREYRMEAPAYEHEALSATTFKVKMQAYQSRRRRLYEFGSWKAAEIMKFMEEEGYRYGFYYFLLLPKMKEKREFNVSIAYIAPNGYVEMDFSGWISMDYISAETYYDFGMTGQNFFDDLYDHTGTIPAGTYAIELYIDGMFVRRDTFEMMKGTK